MDVSHRTVETHLSDSDVESFVALTRRVGSKEQKAILDDYAKGARLSIAISVQPGKITGYQSLSVSVREVF